MGSNGWKKYKLGEFAQLVKQQYLPNLEEEFPYIGLEHIEQQTLRLSGIGKSSAAISQKFKFVSGDILFGKLRPYFRKVYRPRFDGVCSTDIWVLRAKKGFEQDFLFYFLTNQEFIDKSNSGSTGTRMPRADWSHLSETEWKLPPTPIQRRIAAILSALDEKIELNRQTNATLEAIAQAIFKEWFVDFRFPGASGELIESELGLIPCGWRVGKLGDICYVQNGYAFKSTDFNDVGDIGIVKIKNINGNLVDVQSTQYVEYTVVRHLDRKFKTNAGNLLIAMTGAEVGKLGLVPQTDKELWLNQRVGRFVEKITHSNNYLYITS